MVTSVHTCLLKEHCIISVIWLICAIRYIEFCYLK